MCVNDSLSVNIFSFFFSSFGRFALTVNYTILISVFSGLSHKLNMDDEIEHELNIEENRDNNHLIHLCY